MPRSRDAGRLLAFGQYPRVVLAPLKLEAVIPELAPPALQPPLTPTPFTTCSPTPATTRLGFSSSASSRACNRARGSSIHTQEYGHVTGNPARGKRRRLKTLKPRRTWLELDEARSLLDTAGPHRALLATMILAGPRVGELCALRWQDVDLAGAKLTVQKAKTETGRRTVDLSPALLDELKLHRANARDDGPADLVFPTRRGTTRDRNNVRSRVLAGAIGRANKKRAEDGWPPIQPGVTNHTLRRTFASLLYEAGASPAYVMSQMGHSSSALALEVYARKMDRQRDTGARMDALIRGADWAQMGTNGTAEAVEAGAADNPEEAETLL